MSNEMKLKLSTEKINVDYLNNLIINYTDEIPEIKDGSFKTDKLEVRGFDDSIIELGKIIISFDVNFGIEILTVFAAISKAIVDYMKSTKGNVTIINKDKEIRLENFTEKEIIRLLENINQPEVNQYENKIVHGLYTNKEKIIDLLYDKNKGEYYIPDHPDFARNQNWIDNGYDGTGTIIAVLDSGILFSHPYLQNKIIRSIDLTGEGPEDLNGHGTLTSLILAIGAPGIKIINIKVLDKDKSGLPQDLIKGIKLACENEVDSINISAGFELTEENKHYCTEIENILQSCDIPVIASAGNDPKKTYIPACCNSVISVGAADFLGKNILPSSSKGDVYAIGEFKRIKI